MREGGEDGWSGLLGLGFLGVEFRLHGMRILVVLYGGLQNPQRLLRIQGVFPMLTG